MLNIILVQNQTNLGTFLSQVCCYCVVEARDRLVGLSESGCGASRWDHTHRADVENGTKLRLRGRRREPCFLSLQARRPPPVADARAEVARVRRRRSPHPSPLPRGPSLRAAPAGHGPRRLTARRCLLLVTVVHGVHHQLRLLGLVEKVQAFAVPHRVERPHLLLQAKPLQSREALADVQQRRETRAGG